MRSAVSMALALCPSQGVTSGYQASGRTGRQRGAAAR